MNKSIQSILILGVVALSAASAQAQRSFTGSIGAAEGTRLFNSAGTDNTTYTLQIGSFGSSGFDGRNMFGWNNAVGGSNGGFIELGRGSLSGGTLALDGDGFFFNFNYTAGNNSLGTNPGQIYPSARVTSTETFLDTSALAYLVLTENDFADGTREVFVGEFNTALLGFDPESNQTDNLLALVDDAQFFSVSVGSIATSAGITTLSSASAIPEPSSLSLLVAGGAALMALRRRRA